MADPYLGEIQIFPIKFVPDIWLPCDGRSLSIAVYPGLYSVIGTIYGADGRDKFRLPDLRGQAVLGPGTTPNGNGQNGRTYKVGDTLGQKQQSVTLTLQNLPSHTHAFMRAQTSQASAKTNKPSNSTTLGRLALNAAATPIYENAGTTAPPNTSFAPTVLSAFGGTPQGGASPHENQQPYLALTYAICVLGGEYPIRG